MIVYIPKPHHRLTCFKFFESISNYFWKDEDKLDSVMFKVQKVIDVLYNNWMDKLKNKMFIRLNKADSWNADVTIAILAYPIVKQLFNTNHGYFIVYDVDVPNELKNGDDFTLTNNGDKYNYVMGEILFALDKCRGDWEDEFYLMSNDDSEVWKENVKFDEDGHKKTSERINNGLRLFGKYYRCLWD